MPFRLQSAASFCWSSWVNGICGGISARSVGIEAARRVPVVPLLECNDGRSLLAAALSAMGIALEPAFVVGPAIRTGQLVPVLSDWDIATVLVHAVYPANRHIAVKVRMFVSFLVNHLSGDPDLRREKS